MMSRPPSFQVRERARQSDWFEKNIDRNGAAYPLEPSLIALNLPPSIREDVLAYFDMHRIAWHKYAASAHSSQICCLNFLAPMRNDPEALARLVAAVLSIPEPEMLPVENGPDGRPWYVGFEWTGGDYLNEANGSGSRTRGANVTSADAVVKYRLEGCQETMLIEWKYTENYGRPIDPKGNRTRVERYKDLAFAPNGPIRSDLGLSLTDFFYEPFYQLVRQQMLANEMEKAHEDGSERVRLLHVSPAANTGLKAVTAPQLRHLADNACSAFARVLVKPDRFVSRSTETLFGPLLSARANGQSEYLLHRYEFLSDSQSNAQ
jgi:hypothetical protein